MIARRTFLASLPAAALATRSTFAAPKKTVSKRIYIGTGGRGPTAGIYTADWNAATGEIGPITQASNVASPSFIATFQNGADTFVYAVTEAGRGNSKITALKAVDGGKTLQVLNDSPSNGGGPTHIAVSPDGRSVYVANYGGGSVTSYHVRPDGSLSAPVSHFQFTGSGPYKGRQEGPHTHSVNPSPDGKWLLVNDLGIDRIMVYRVNPATAELTPNEPAFYAGRPGSGPRHVAWNPNGKFVYVANELDSTVDTLSWDAKTGTLKSIQYLSSLKEGFPPNTAFVGEILSSSDGRNVYAGNRVADDTIAVFDVDKKTGKLTQVQLAEGGGKNARHVAIDPTQHWIVISHVDSNDLVVLERNLKTGRLSAPVHTYPQNKPMCVVFV
jgi:6-phosphogluconolactonase (cycloisomerase 2 family)